MPLVVVVDLAFIYSFEIRKKGFLSCSGTHTTTTTTRG
jgi:hypothetical protein